MTGVNELEEKQARIDKEQKRLTRLYSKIDKKRKAVIQGLIERAAFMRVSLDDMEEDLNVYGFTEMFQQGRQEPYERERPVAKQYNSMNTSYQKIIKQLTDLLPKQVEQQKDDGFDSFVSERADI